MGSNGNCGCAGSRGFLARLRSGVSSASSGLERGDFAIPRLHQAKLKKTIKEVLAHASDEFNAVCLKAADKSPRDRGIIIVTIAEKLVAVFPFLQRR